MIYNSHKIWFLSLDMHSLVAEIFWRKLGKCLKNKYFVGLAFHWETQAWCTSKLINHKQLSYHWLLVGRHHSPISLLPPPSFSDRNLLFPLVQSTQGCHVINTSPFIFFSRSSYQKSSGIHKWIQVGVKLSRPTNRAGTRRYFPSTLKHFYLKRFHFSASDIHSCCIVSQ